MQKCRFITILLLLMLADGLLTLNMADYAGMEKLVYPSC